MSRAAGVTGLFFISSKSVANGSDQTTLLKVVRGQLRPPPRVGGSKIALITSAVSEKARQRFGPTRAHGMQLNPGNMHLHHNRTRPKSFRRSLGILAWLLDTVVSVQLRHWWVTLSDRCPSRHPM